MARKIVTRDVDVKEVKVAERMADGRPASEGRGPNALARQCGIGYLPCRVGLFPDTIELMNPFRTSQFVFLKRSAPALLCILAFFAPGMAASAQDGVEPAEAPGIRVRFKAGDATDARVDDSVQLFVSAGQSPTPFLAGGTFEAVWEGFISVDLRDRYEFRVEANGAYKLEINDVVALEGSGSGEQPSEPSKRIRLGKGNNQLKVSYSSPAKGDAMLRLFWSSPDFDFEPVPAKALSHAEDAALAAASELRRGRERFVERRCHKCHVGAGPESGMVELALDAPTFEGIGSRRNMDWMRRWILDPTAFRHASVARMPKLFEGANAGKDAAAAAAYLASLKTASGAKGSVSGDVDKGAHLFTTLHCEACHQAPGSHAADDVKISLNFVNQKFAPGALTQFLQKPESHYAWIRMPDFRLSLDEAAGLAGFLRSKAASVDGAAGPAAADIARGKQLVERVGCLNCHSGPGENRFARSSTLTRADAGCLAESTDASSKAARYALSDGERAALRAFVGSRGGSDSLKRHVPAEFAKRQIQSLGCANCHGNYDGFPKLNSLGGKLRPEWTEQFIAGQVNEKPRYWAPDRMPAFATRAGGLARGMAASHGLGPVSPKQPEIDAEMAAAGRKMVGTDGGFSCIACHAVKEFGAQQVFESAGINFGQVGERLRKEFFQRWLLNPLRVDPGTKMPVYFAGGMSPLFDFYEGDANKQIDAFWEYIRQGDKMPLPAEAGN